MLCSRQIQIFLLVQSSNNRIVHKQFSEKNLTKTVLFQTTVVMISSRKFKRTTFYFSKLAIDVLTNEGKQD